MSAHTGPIIHDLLAGEDVLGLCTEPEAAASAPFSVERRWERVKIDAKITVRITYNGTSEFLLGQANDVCEGGMAVYLPGDLEIGSTLEVTMMLPVNKKPIGFFAQISNRNGFRYGLEFSGLSDAQSIELKNSIIAISHAQ